jgi:hypothetical protein
MSPELAHRDLASRIQVRNALKADKPEPTRMTQTGHCAVGIRPEIMECPDASFRLHTCKLDDLRPLFGFFGHQLSKIGGRACKHGASHVTDL